MGELHQKGDFNKDLVSKSYVILLIFKATGSTNGTSQRKSNPEVELPRPLKTINKSETRNSVPIQISSSEVAVNGNIPPPGIPTICIDTGVCGPKYLRATNT